MAKKILIVGPCLSMGGIERSSSTLANLFSDSEHKISYVTIFRREHFFNLNKNIDLYEPPYELNRNKIIILKTIKWLRNTIKLINPDVIIVFNKFYGALVSFSILFLKIPYFITERSSPFYKWPFHIALFNRLAFSINPPYGVIAQTEIAAEIQRKFYSCKTQIEIIPNTLREVKLYPAVKRQNFVLAVGRLNDYLKGFDRLIEAFSYIKNKDWKLIFAGGDEEGQALKKLACKLGISDRVIFLGKVREIDRVYAKAGIFVIPSRSEGFPNALCEAMAAGLPCISFDFIAGPREIITHGYDGLIIENGNIKALSEAIDYLIEKPNERERLGHNALKIRKRLSQEKISKKYLDFILGI